MTNHVTFNPDYPDISRSEELFSRSNGLIPCNTQTMAKGPTQYVDGLAPKYLAKGKGSHVWDVDGNEYIDYNMGIGPISLGYAYPLVDEAIRRQLADGITFSLMHPLEVEVAELIQEFIPNAEAVRFSKTGAEATSAAIRIARAFTGRDRILCCGYHGWHDWYASTLARNAGIPQSVQDLTYTFSYNDIDSLKQAINRDVAAVILEPAVFEEPVDGFLYKVQDLCHKHGTLLIFDEMWTGFRLSPGGAQEYFGIIADLATYSKAVANGMPLSVVTGRYDIMQVLEDDVFFFNTFGGEALSLAAAKATLTEIRDRNVCKALWQKGQILKSGLESLFHAADADFMSLKGYPYRTLLNFDASAGDPLILKSYVQQELIKRGILWSGFQTLSYSHTREDLEYTLKAWEEVIFLLKDSIAKRDTLSRLRGNPIRPTLRATTSFHTKAWKE